MTPPELNTDATPVDKDTDGPRRITIGNATITALQPPEGLVISIDLRYRNAERQEANGGSSGDLFKIFEDALFRLVPDQDDVNAVIDELGAGRVDAQEMLRKLLGIEPNNRAERRQAPVAQRSAGNRRRGGHGRR